MQEVGVFAVPVSVRPYLVFEHFLLHKFIFPPVSVIATLGVLQLIQQVLVFIDDLRQPSDSVRAVKRSVRVQALGIRFSLVEG